MSGMIETKVEKGTSMETGTIEATTTGLESTAETEKETETETGGRTGMSMEVCKTASLGEGIQW